MDATFFLLKVIVTKMCQKVLTRNISGIVTEHIKFYPYFFSFGNLSKKKDKKNQFHGSDQALSKIFHETIYNFITLPFHIRNFGLV